MKWALTIAKIIMIIWAMEWIWFGLGSLIVGGGIVDIFYTAAMLAVIPGFFFLARRWPLVAGILLVLIGALWTAAHFYSDQSSHILLMNGLPPLFSGILFLLSRPRRQRV